LDAVQKAEKLEPNLILLDLNMPRLNGAVAASALKNVMPDTPIILFTMYNDMLGDALWSTLGVESLSKTDGVSKLLERVDGAGEHRARKEVNASKKWPIMTFEAALLSVWRQSLIDNSKTVDLGDQSFPVTKTSARQLKQITFQFAGRTIRGIEQNPVTKSRWAALARVGQKVMQFVENGSYVAVVVDGKVHSYGKR
jgi:DNA-binding response OmpR family regulator